MLIATFGPTTAWVGKTIFYQDGRLVLEGHGPVTPGAVLEYDRQGHLTWAHEGLREWVRGLAQSAQPTTRSRVTMPAWLIAVLACAAVLLVGALLAAIAIPAFQVQREKTRVATVKAGIRAIQAGLEASAADHNDAYPLPSAVTRSSLQHYVGAWPDNPYTGQPMTQGSGAGDFEYSVYDNGLSFDLTGYVANGTAIVRVRRVAVTRANAQAIAEGVHSIQVGVETYAIDHDGTYPDATLVAQNGLDAYVDNWPANPYTGLPMTLGGNEGDFGYSVSTDGRQYQLIGYGDDGVIMVRVP